MGDRAVISNKNKNLGIYLHWESGHVDRLNDKRKAEVEEKIKMQKEEQEKQEQDFTNCKQKVENKVKEQDIPYEILEQNGTIYELKGSGELDR